MPGHTVSGDMMWDLNSEIYFGVLWIFFVFSGIFFVWTGRRVWVHMVVHTLCPVHTIYYNIYTFYIQFFWVYLLFLIFLWDFILITSLQERGRAAPYPMTLLQVYIFCILITRTGRRVWVHMVVHTLCPVHTIYYNIYTFYIQFFWVYLLFLIFLWDFILITSLQERGRAAPYPMTLLQYVQCYIHGWRWWYDGWVMSGFGFSEIKLSPINTRIFCWKINYWVYD